MLVYCFIMMLFWTFIICDWFRFWLWMFLYYVCICLVYVDCLTGLTVGFNFVIAVGFSCFVVNVVMLGCRLSFACWLIDLYDCLISWLFWSCFVAGCCVFFVVLLLTFVALFKLWFLVWVCLIYGCLSIVVIDYDVCLFALTLEFLIG